MDGNRKVARFIHDLTWEALPPEVQQKAKLVFLDALCAAVSGSLAHISCVTASFASRVLPGSDATILFDGRKSSAAGAAFANANAANAFDSDDIGQYTRGHPGAQIIPVALAVAEKQHKSGKELLAGMIAGYEVAHRTGRCWHDDHSVYQACGSWGTVANAATAAHLMGLSEEQIWHALGIADYYAPNLPMMRDAVAPAMVKHGVGWAAMSGILAAELAQDGFTGIPSILGFEKYGDWIGDIGEHYIVTGGAIFKEYASCGWNHAALDAIRSLRARYDFAVEDIEHIRLEGFNEMILLGSRVPASTEDAQFNTGWAMTVLLLDGLVGPAQMVPERWHDPAAVALLNKIELVESERFNDLATRANFGDPQGGYACELTVRLRDGRRLESGITIGGNKYTQQWTDAQMDEKFRWLMGFVLPRPVVDRVTEMAWNFEREPDVTALVELCTRSMR